MPTVTPRTLCTAALKKSAVLGIGRSPLAEDLNDAFSDLNDMIASWQVERWNVYTIEDVAFVCNGDESYTVGPPVSNIIQNYPFVERPDRLEAAYLRQLFNTSPGNPVDYFLKLISSYEDYAQIQLKNLGTISTHCFYNPAYPVGLAYPWPVPQANLYELHLLFKTPIGNFSNLSQPINLPQSYFAAIKHNLAVWLCVAYGREVPPDLAKIAGKTLAALQNSNAQIPALSMPKSVVRPSGLYNVFSDQVY